MMTFILIVEDEYVNYLIKFGELYEILRFKSGLKCDKYVRIILSQFAVCEKNETLWFREETKI